MNLRDTIKLIFLFLLTYLVLYFLPAITKAINPEVALHEWGFTLNPSMLDYTFFLMPFVGFFFIYFLIDWINEFFETNFASSVYFPLLFVVLCFLAFYVQLFWYYSNIASLQNAQAIAQGSNVKYVLDISLSPACQQVIELLDPANNLYTYRICFWNTLRADAFFVFIFSGLAGWISRKVMLNVSEDALEEKRKENIKPKPVLQKEQPAKTKETEQKTY